MSIHLSQKAKAVSIILSVIAGFIMIGFLPVPARAADCPYPVADPSSNDNPTKVIRLISPALTDNNSVRRYDLESLFTQDCDWFGVGMRFNQVYVPFGLKTYLSYHVADASGVPLVDEVVKLRVNKGYSSSNANVRVNGIKARPAPSNASDGAIAFGTTDVNGNVTFVIQSPDDCEAYGGVLPAAPTSLNSATPNDRNADPSTDCFSQILPSIAGEKLDSTDWVEIHYFNSSGMNYQTSPGQSFVQVPMLNSENSIQAPLLISKYTPVGSGQILVFAFRDTLGKYLSNREVQVRINLAANQSNALVGAGIFGVHGFGDSITTSTPTSSEVNLSGLTDAFGALALLLKNSDTTGESKPDSLTSPVPTQNRKFSSILPQISGSNLESSTLNLHFVTGLKLPGMKLSAPSDVKVSANGLSITVSWTNDQANEGLTSNEVYDSSNNLVCSTGPSQSCTFDWDISKAGGSESYYVVPKAGVTKGPGSAPSNSFALSSSKPVMYAPNRNFSVSETIPLLALGLPANSVAYLRDGIQVIQYRTNSAGVLSVDYQIQKLGITSLSIKVGTKLATSKVYSPYDKATSGFCRRGNTIKIPYVSLLPNSVVEVQVSDGRDVISTSADQKGNATVLINCNNIGGFLWSAKVGDLNLAGGGFTVR